MLLYAITDDWYDVGAGFYVKANNLAISIEASDCGYGDKSTFQPNAPITRLEASRMLVKALKRDSKI